MLSHVVRSGFLLYMKRSSQQQIDIALLHLTYNFIKIKESTSLQIDEFIKGLISYFYLNIYSKRHEKSKN